MKTKYLAVKFVDEEQGIVEGFGAPYGGPCNGKDLQGEFFSPKTDFCLKWFDTRPILYHHGLDADMKTDVAGVQTSVEDRPDGQWIKAQLDRSQRYWSDLKALIKAGKIFFSSGSIPHLVEKAANGEILRWPWVETSLTPSPANPGARIEAFKALAYLKTVGATDAQLMALKITNEEGKNMSAPAVKDFEKPEGSPTFVKDDSHADPAVSAMNGDKPNLAGPAPSASGPGNFPTVSPPPEQSVKAEPVAPPAPPAPPPVAPVAPAQPQAPVVPQVILPPEVLKALQALQASVNKILSGQGPASQETPESEGQETAGPAGDKPAVPSEPGVNQGMAPETHIEKPEPPKPEEKPETKNMSSAVDVQKEPVVDSPKTQFSENTANKATMRIDLCRKFGTQTGMKMYEEMVKQLPAETAVKSADNTPAIKSLEEENKALKGEVERLKKLPANEGPVLRAVKTTETGAVPNPRIPTTVIEEAQVKVKALQEMRDDPATPAAIKSYIGEKLALKEMKDLMRAGPQPIGQKNKTVVKE